MAKRQDIGDVFKRALAQKEIDRRENERRLKTQQEQTVAQANRTQELMAQEARIEHENRLAYDPDFDGYDDNDNIDHAIEREQMMAEREYAYAESAAMETIAEMETGASNFVAPAVIGGAAAGVVAFQAHALKGVVQTGAEELGKLAESVQGMIAQYEEPLMSDEKKEALGSLLTGSTQELSELQKQIQQYTAAGNHEMAEAATNSYMEKFMNLTEKIGSIMRTNMEQEGDVASRIYKAQMEKSIGSVCQEALAHMNGAFAGYVAARSNALEYEAQDKAVDPKELKTHVGGMDIMKKLESLTTVDRRGGQMPELTY